ncbi:MAG: NAD-dependent epimerase/dehydratase family protein [Pseudomonadota bacterium]
MRVLVTGGGGFLGRHLIAGLVARGDQAVAFDRAFPEPVPDAVCHIGDVTDPVAVEQAVAGCAGVIHAAALTGLWARDPAVFDQVNRGGTETVLGAAAKAGVRRAVHVSSYTTLIAGPRGPWRTVDETVEWPETAMLGPYPRSKWQAERVAEQAAVPTAIVLPAAPIGPGDATPTPPGAMLRDLANGALPAMIDCGWALVDVRAVAEATLVALDRGEAGRRYLLAGETLDTAALMALFERVSGVTPPRARVPHGIALAAGLVEAPVARLRCKPPTAPLTGVRLAGPRLRFDAARARAELGFAPPPVEAALRDALLWMRAQGWLSRALPGLPQP